MTGQLSYLFWLCEGIPPAAIVVTGELKFYKLLFSIVLT